MKFSTILVLALPALALAVPVSDADWVNHDYEGPPGYPEPSSYPGTPTPTAPHCATHSVHHKGWKRSQNAKRAASSEDEDWKSCYPAEPVPYKPYKRFAKRNALPDVETALEPPTDPQIDDAFKRSAMPEPEPAPEANNEGVSVSESGLSATAYQAYKRTADPLPGPLPEPQPALDDSTQAFSESGVLERPLYKRDAVSDDNLEGLSEVLTA